MAKFTGDISDVKGASSSPTSPSSFVQDKGSGLQTLGSLFQTAAGGLSKATAKQRQLDAGSAIGEAQTTILDLQDERSRLVMEDREIQNTITNIYQDQNVTEEEQATLNSIQERRKFLDESRKTGLLNDTAFQIRMNALHKQSLSAVQNLGIQSQINQLFSQGRSQISAGESKAELEFKQEMDETYGVGNWTAEDAGRKRAAALYNAKALEQGAIDITTLQIQTPQVFTNMLDPLVTRLNTSIAQNGALTDANADLYRAAVTEQYTEATKHLNDMVNKIHSDPTRTLAKEQLEAIREMRKDLVTMRDSYLSLLSDEGGKLGAAGVSKRIKQAADVMANLTKIQNPQAASAASAAIGSGNASLMEWATIIGNKQVLDAVRTNLPESIRALTTVEDMQNQIAKMIHYSLQPGATLQQAVDIGAVNPVLAKTIALKGLPKAETEEDVRRALAAFEKIDWGNMNDTFDTLADSRQVATIRGLKGGAKSAAAKVMNTNLNNYAQAIKAEVDGLHQMKIKRAKDGTFELMAAPSPASGTMPIPRLRDGTTRRVNKYLALVDRYKDLTGLSPEEASQLLLSEPFEVSGSGVENQNQPEEG